MTVQARTDTGGDTAETRDAHEGDVNLVSNQPGSFETEDVTATVTSDAHPTSDTPTVAEFMSAVVAWPETPTDPGYVDLQNTYYDRKSPDGKRAGKWPMSNGEPFRSVDEFVRRAVWMTTSTQHKDVYYCLSTQSTAKPNPHKPGKLIATRAAANALKVKSIWIDMDVGDGPNKYPTVQDALKSLTTFRLIAGLPQASAIVFSGSGVHVYWISDTALTPAEWASYARGLKALLLQHGVKCDSGITTDIARILRVPETLNHKTNSPLPVGLSPLPLRLYKFDIALAFLTEIAPLAAATPGSAKPAHNLFADGITDEERAAFKKPPAFKIAEPDLDAGINRSADAPLDPQPIFSQCGFLREALLTGGRDYNEPLWNLSVLCATFMKNGNDIAHLISKGHPSYSAAETEAKFDLKMAAGVGYPSCATIQGAGCTSCATCPLLLKGKSPLNIRPDVAATVNPAAGDTPQADPSFVDPYAEFVGPEFPLDILPPTLANFVDAEHRAMGADPAAIAMAALTAVAAAMHAETQVRVGDGWWERPIFWTSLLGQPSSMKSPILKKATEPLLRIDHGRGKFWHQEYTAWAQTPNHQTIQIPPRPARCVINDATPEKVAEVLSRNPSGSFMVLDELAGWLGGFERYNAGQSQRAFYLTAWNGGTFLKDRVGKGKNDIDAEVHVDNLALCILGGIQPDRLTKLGDLTSDGLLQRFLTVLMKSAKLGDPEYPVTGAEDQYETLIKSINALPARNYHFADDASEVRDDVLGYLHKLEQVDGFSPSLIGAIGKLKGYFARICLVLHVVRTLDDPLIRPEINFILADAFRNLDPSENLSAGVNVNTAIPREIAEAAKKLLLEFLLPHMSGLYDVVTNGGQERDKLQSIANFILASDKDRLRPSDFTAGVRTLRGEPEQKIREWVGRFCSMDWLSPEEGKPGVPAKAWQVAPGLRDHFTERRKHAQVARAEMHAILKAGGSRKSR